MKKTCCFTGHRPNGLPWKYDEHDISCTVFKHQLKVIIKQLIEDGYNNFISGMAIGVDMIAAEIILELKEKHNISLEAAIPCENQCKFWNDEYTKRYKTILEKCDKITYISKSYTDNCMMLRNYYMVDNSDFVIAVWNGSQRSGTAQTINYANKNNKQIYIITI